MSKRQLMSETERIALTSGTTGFDGSLVNGKPDFSYLRDTSPFTLTEKEQSYLDNELEDLCAAIDDWALHTSDTQMISDELMQKMKDTGLFGIVIPEEYGGLGFSEYMHSMIVQKLSSRSFAAAIIPMVINSLGPGKLVKRYGTQAQKDEILPKIASGEYVTCFGATESAAGSDLFSMLSKGTIKRNDKGDRYIHIDNLDKRYITLAPIANLPMVAYQLEDEDGNDQGICISLVPRNTEGLEIGNRLSPNGLPFPNGTIRGDIKIPVDSIVGGEERIGDHTLMLMECLSIGRGITLPNGGTAAAKKAAYVAGAFAASRIQFGRTIKDFQGLERPLAKIAGLTYLADATCRFTARSVDDGALPTVASAIAKNHMIDIMKTTLTEASTLMCGKGVMVGPSNPLANDLKGIPVAEAVEGAKFLTEFLIIGVQGVMRSHKRAFPMLEAMENGQNMKVLGQGLGMISDTILASIRSSLPAYMHNYGVRNPDSKNAHYYQHINRLSSALQLCVNVSLMKFQQGLKSEGRLTGRIGDVLSHLYMAGCALEKFERDGCLDEDRDLLDWSVRYCLHKTEEAFDDLIVNYPSLFTTKESVANPHADDVQSTEKVRRSSKLSASFLRASIFPFYQTNTRRWKPNDQLERRVAQTIIKPGSVRDRLTDGIYKPTDPETESLAAFNDALEKSHTANEIHKLVRKENRKMSEEERKIVALADKARAKIVAVDEFMPDGKTLYKSALEA